MADNGDKYRIPVTTSGAEIGHLGAGVDVYASTLATAGTTWSSA